MASASIARAELRGTVRAAARIAAILLLFPPALLLHGGWRLVRRPSPWPPRFLAAVAWIVGARVRRVGPAPPRGALLIANHVSWLDILVLAGATGTSFVAKGELARTPLVGWLARMNATIFVDRSRRMGVTDQIARIRDALAGGRPVTIFPEGTTGDGTNLLPFKPALLAVAEEPPPGMLVQPVRMDYGAAAGEVAWLGDEPGVANVLRILRRAGTITVTIRLRAPFDPSDYAGRKAIAAEACRRIGD